MQVSSLCFLEQDLLLVHYLLVGSLIEVGRGKREPEWIAGLIANGSRSDAGSSVPGKALFFTGAAYK